MGEFAAAAIFAFAEGVKLADSVNVVRESSRCSCWECIDESVGARSRRRIRLGQVLSRSSAWKWRLSEDSRELFDIHAELFKL